MPWQIDLDKVLGIATGHVHALVVNVVAFIDRTKPVCVRNLMDTAL